MNGGHSTFSVLAAVYGPLFLPYGLAWASFGLGHSLLAGPWAKRRLTPWLGPWYRLAYNLIALAHFMAVALVGQMTLARLPALPLPGTAKTAMIAVHLLGWAVLLVAGRGYDAGRLLGLYQLRHRGEPEDEALRTEGLHRYVRHPLYLGAYLILWGSATTPLGLATALFGSLYLAIGTWFEERKLIRLYGDAYRDYRAKVPAVIPWKGRAY